MTLLHNVDKVLLRGGSARPAFGGGEALEVEQSLNCAEAKRLHPEIGYDIKVMGVRRGSITRLTVGCAFVDRFVNDIDDEVGRGNRRRTMRVFTQSR